MDLSRVLYNTAMSDDALATYRPGGGVPVCPMPHPADGASGYALRLPNGVIVWTSGTGDIRSLPRKAVAKAEASTD